MESKRLETLEEVYSVVEVETSHVYIYGAGRVSYALIKALASHNKNILMRISALVVSNKALNPDRILGIKVISISEAEHEHINSIIVAAFEDAYDKIFAELLSLGIKKVFLITEKAYCQMCNESESYEIDSIGSIQLCKNEITRLKVNYNDWSVKTRRNLLDLDKKIEIVRGEAQRTEETIREVIWGMNFDNAIKECSWCKRKDFAPTGMAVGYYYLYILFKALDSGHFASFLDIGMGQTTKLFSQYVRYDMKTNLTVVESDSEWVDFFKGNIEPEYMNLVLLDCEYSDFEKEKGVRTYKSFRERLSKSKFDIISIDGPYGGDMDEWSRVDVLSLLPDCLAESWIILVDDISRKGEKNTFNRILKLLEENEIRHTYAVHHGSNSFGVITSEDNRFYCRV